MQALEPSPTRRSWRVRDPERPNSSRKSAFISKGLFLQRQRKVEGRRAFAASRSNAGLGSTLYGRTIKATTFCDDGIGELLGAGMAAWGEKDRVNFNGEYGNGRGLGRSTAIGKGSGMVLNKGGGILHGFEAPLTIRRRERELPRLYPLVYSFAPLTVHEQTGCCQDATIKRAAG